MKKKFLLTTLTTTLLFGSLALAPVASADQYESGIQNNLNKIQESESKVHTLEETIESLQVEVQNTEKELTLINDDITANENKIAEVVERLETAHAEMLVLQEEIAQLEIIIAKRTEQLENQARTIQIDGQTANYIEFVINAESLSDVFGRINVVSNLVNSNKKLIDAQERDKEAVVVKQNKTEETITQQNALAAELEVMSEELDEKRLEKEVLVAQLASERATAESERNHFLAQKAEAEQAVVQLVAAREAEKEAVRIAEERRRVEAAAASTPDSSEEVSVASSERSTSNDSTTSTNNTASTPAASKPAAKPKEKPKAKPAPAPSGGTGWSALAPHANALLGTRYVYGGSTTAGFDCSGFTSYVFNKIGKSLPRSAAGQYAGSQKVSNPVPGDLVFFSAGGGRVTHVGIYVGGGQFIGSQTSTGVAYTAVHGPYWGARFVGYGRY